MPLLEEIESLTKWIEYKQGQIAFGKQQQQAILKRMGENMTSYIKYIDKMEAIQVETEKKYRVKKITEDEYQSLLQEKETLIQQTQRAYREEMRKDKAGFDMLEKSIAILNAQIHELGEKIVALMKANPEETQKLKPETAIYLLSHSRFNFLGNIAPADSGQPKASITEIINTSLSPSPPS